MCESGYSKITMTRSDFVIIQKTRDGLSTTYIPNGVIRYNGGDAAVTVSNNTVNCMAEAMFMTMVNASKHILKEQRCER